MQVGLQLKENTEQNSGEMIQMQSHDFISCETPGMFTDQAYLHLLQPAARQLLLQNVEQDEREHSL